jgi:hypothetical protein
MQLHTPLSARLTGNDAELQRRQQLLALLLDGYERGGADEAAAALAREFEPLERTFVQHLNELHQLL